MRLHPVPNVGSALTQTGEAAATDPIEAIRLAPRTKKQIAWNLFWSMLIGAVTCYSAATGESDLAFFLSVALVGLGLGLLYYVGCIVASIRSGIPIPQTLIDRHGVANVGLFSFQFNAWTDLSNMIVFEEWNDGTTYDLMAFAKDQPMPESEKDKKRSAKLRLSLPGLRNTVNDTYIVYDEYCRFINAWRRHALDGGRAPGPSSLVWIAERVDVAALSKAEHEASWRAICARY